MQNASRAPEPDPDHQRGAVPLIKRLVALSALGRQFPSHRFAAHLLLHGNAVPAPTRHPMQNKGRG
ncbi:MAG: hypothetical protein EXR48_03450 [Dehalococcoidia bacterium]|nr:hypothetical protein [Dehalococcoidia bacterium]